MTRYCSNCVKIQQHHVLDTEVNYSMIQGLIQEDHIWKDCEYRFFPARIAGFRGEEEEERSLRVYLHVCCFGCFLHWHDSLDDVYCKCTHMFFSIFLCTHFPGSQPVPPPLAKKLLNKEEKLCLCRLYFFSLSTELILQLLNQPRHVKCRDLQ